MADYTLPSGLIFSNLSLTQEIPTFTNESISLKVKSKSRGLHRLSGSLDVTVSDLVSQRAYMGFLARCQGRSSTFELDLPLHFKSSGVTNPQATTAVSVGATEIQLGSFSGTIYAGAMFNMPNDDKTYVVTEDARAGAVLRFFPAMRVSHLVNSIVEVVNPVLTVRFTGDNQELSFDEAGQVVTTSIDWQEAL